MTNKTVPPHNLTAATEETFRNLRIKKRLTEEEFASVFEKMALDKYGTIKAAAKQWKVSRQYIDQIVDCSRPVPPRMCDQLGYTKEKVTFYVKD